MDMVSNNENFEKKAKLRIYFKEVIQHSPWDEIGAKIIAYLKAILPGSARVGAFYPRADEPQIESLLRDPLYRFAFPRIAAESLQFYIPQAESHYEINRFGISEPNPAFSEKIELDTMAAILVPAVAFDRKGVRLGRGLGFYDRVLAKYKGLKIGVGSATQVTNEDLPADPHDVAMDIVVTDQFVLRRFDS